MWRLTTGRFWIPLVITASLLTPGAEARGVKRASRPATAIKIPRSRPPVYKAPKRKAPSYKAPKLRKESSFKRDPAARRAFQQYNPCPSTGKRTGKCPGYVVDHIRPLKRGGPDTPDNMQWQTKEAAKAKDRIE